MNYKDLENKINNMTVADCNLYYLIDDIESAKYAEQNSIHHWITDIEHVEINLDTLEVTNSPEYSKDDIKKAYAIKECYSKYTLNYICKYLLNSYYLYETLEEYTNEYLEGNCWDDDLTQNDKIEIINNNIENLIKTSWGYLEA